MKHISRWVAAMIAALMILSSAAAAGAAQADAAPSGAQKDLAIVAADYDEVGSTLSPAGALPASYSSVDLGYVTPVRNQIYNTCWAYASTALLETVMIKNGDMVGHLSPMHMNYWATIREDGTGWQRGINDKGFPYIALGYLTSWDGARLESDFPHTTPYYEYDRLTETTSIYSGATSVMYLDGNDRDTIKTAVQTYGGVLANFHSNNDYLNFDTGAYYDNEPGLTTAQLMGHVVEIVGWDDAYSRENFNESVAIVTETPTDDPDNPVEQVVSYRDARPAHDGAWLCKNSWGPTWGPLNGYFWISYEDYYIFESRFGPSYAITGYALKTDDNRLKQVETYGAICDFDYIRGSRLKKLTYANVLDFSDNYRVLDKVIFETESEGADYEIYLIPLDDSNKPDSSVSRWEKLASGTVEYQGYHCVEIDERIIRDDRCAIGVTLSKTDARDSIGVGVDEWLSLSGRNAFIPDSKYGVSYILGYDTEAIDVMDLYLDSLDDDIGGNFVIKALTENIGKIGDADLDGLVTILDVTKIQRKLANLTTLSERQEVLGDYDRDGLLSILDATKIQRMLAGLDEEIE